MINFTTTKIQDLIQTDKSILKLKLRVHDESTKIYNNIDKNLIVLKDIIPPESLNVTEFGKITDDASLLKFCQEKNEQKVKSYADYNKAQKIAFWNIIRNNILNVENKKLSLETVFEFHIFAFGNTRIDREDFSDELYGILNEHRPGIFWYPEYLNVPGYKIKDSEDKINSMKPIFDFIKQHRAKCKNRCNTLNYINLIDCFYDMCNEKFTWQDILDLNLIKLENADDFQKLGSDGLSSIINILGYCLCLSKNSNDKEAITAIKNIFANMSNSVVTLDQIVQLLNLCEKNKIDIEMDEKTVTKLFREIENDKRQLNKDELLKICSFCKDNSIPEESMKYVIEKYPSSDLLTPTFINYAKRKTKFNAGSDFNSVNSLAIYDIDWICENYDNNKKISYTKDDFIGLFSFINRKGLCVNVLSIQYYQSYRKRKSFGDMKNFANDILNDKNRINKSENKIIQNNKLTLAELHVIFFSDFSFDNESYDVTEQQFKNMIPDEIDFGYLKFLLLFYSERNKLTNENIIFCFEKYKIGIDENLDDLFKYLDDYYIKMLDEDKKNDLVCKLFDVYINNRKIQSSSDDFNKAKEAKNKYLTQEYLKTITEKENQHPIIDFNENKVSNNKIEIGNGNTYNQSDFIDLSKKN